MDIGSYGVNLRELIAHDNDGLGYATPRHPLRTSCSGHLVARAVQSDPRDAALLCPRRGLCPPSPPSPPSGRAHNPPPSKPSATPLDPAPPNGPATAKTPTTPPQSDKRPRKTTPTTFTLPSISTTSPVRKKVNVTVHARSIWFVHHSTRALEFSIPLTSITRTVLLPTRGKSRSHWTVVLLPTDVPDKSKVSPPSAQKIIVELDALTTAPFETTSYSSGTPTPMSTTTVAKGEETAKSGQGAAGIDAYLAAKLGTLNATRSRHRVHGQTSLAGV